MANEQMNPNPEAGINPLEKYGINLTELSKEGKIDPVIGREDEIRRIVQILSRRKKNNPVLIGEPGTGKTTVVEGLAKRIVDGDVIELPFGGNIDLGYGDVYEWDTINISKQNLKKIVNAQNVSCRLSGNYYYELKNNDMKPIQEKWKQFTNGKLKQYLN
mgnify:CR=1 FL=1